MKLSDLIGKDIVNIVDGAKLGTIGDSDLLIDVNSGKISSIIIPNYNSLFGIWKNKNQLVIPWNSVRKIGSEVIVVEIDYADSKTFI